MKRRKFLGLATAGAAGAAWAAAGGDRTLSDDDVLGLPHAIHYLGHEGARLVGESYRALTPAENTSRTLTRVLIESVSRDPTIPLEARLTERVQRDFAEGQTVTVAGWVLSLTEARQCALHSLQSV